MDRNRVYMYYLGPKIKQENSYRVQKRLSLYCALKFD